MGKIRGRPAASSGRAIEARSPTARRGDDAERAACAHLENGGLTLLCSKYRAPTGEIDLVMRDGETVVFVEVRSRRSASFMSPLETLGYRKVRRIIRTAEHYLQRHRLLDRVYCRFDVVSICGADDSREIEWIRNAFEA